jgi:hypothetical protein
LQTSILSPSDLKRNDWVGELGADFKRLSSSD